jgi:hypothetical protein
MYPSYPRTPPYDTTVTGSQLQAEPRVGGPAQRRVAACCGCASDSSDSCGCGSTSDSGSGSGSGAQQPAEVRLPRRAPAGHGPRGCTESTAPCVSARMKQRHRRQARLSAPNVRLAGGRLPTAAVNGLDIQLDRFRRESTGAIAFIPGTVQPTADDDAYIQDEDDPDYEFPTWWFFLAVPSQSFGPWIVGGTLWGIVVPHTISENFGSQDKAFVLATLGTLGTVMSFASPFTGSLSDRLPEMFPRFTRRFGRRRPFFVVGQVIGVTGIWITKQAFYHKNTPWLFISWGLSNLSWQIAGPPYGSIFTEVIPESQRGLAVTINGWLCQVCQIIGNSMGILLGEGVVSNEFIWDFQIVIGYCQIPLACWAMSGKA